MKLAEIKNELNARGIHKDESTIQADLKRQKVKPEEITVDAIEDLAEFYQRSKVELAPQVQIKEERSIQPVKEVEPVPASLATLPEQSAITTMSLDQVNAYIEQLKPAADAGDEAMIAYLCDLFDRQDQLLNGVRQAIRGKQQAFANELAALPYQAAIDAGYVAKEAGLSAQEFFRTRSERFAQRFPGIKF